MLQRLCISKGLSMPRYDFTQSGPSHRPEFTITLSIGSHINISIVDKKKTHAENIAAAKAIKILSDNFD